MAEHDANWEVTAGELKRRRDAGEAVVLIDVRQAEEHAFCRIEGASLVPLAELQGRVEEVRELAGGRAIVTYCHHGMRSFQAAAILRRAGVGPVHSLAGGIDGWAVEVDGGVGRY